MYVWYDTRTDKLFLSWFSLEAWTSKKSVIGDQIRPLLLGSYFPMYATKVWTNDDWTSGGIILWEGSCHIYIGKFEK